MVLAIGVVAVRPALPQASVATAASAPVSSSAASESAPAFFTSILSTDPFVGSDTGSTTLLIPGALIKAPEAASKPAAAPAPAPQMAHLPSWVQTQGPTTLWSGPDGHALRFTVLPAWTFLKVVGAQGDHLLVQYSGDSTTASAAGLGWVVDTAVQPSDPDGSWLQAFRATQLLPSQNGGAPAATVPQWAQMRVLGKQVGANVPVAAYSPDYTRLLGQGWVRAADVGPSGPPKAPVSTTDQATAAPIAFPDQASFIAGVGAAARAAQAKTGVPASVTVAQAILESDWGRSLLTRESNNYFGIKAMGSMGNDGAVWMRTLEYDANGNPFYEKSPFRAYKSLADSVLDHATLFTSLSRYQSAMAARNDPDEFARQIAADGYSTDPSYPDKLIGLMQKFNLYQFDK